MKEITLTKDEEIIKRRFKAYPEIINQVTNYYVL